MYKGSPVHLYTDVSPYNRTTTPLVAGATFTGSFEETRGFTSIIISVKSDQTGYIYIDHSQDGSTVDLTTTFDLEAGYTDVHRVTTAMQFYRIRVYNSSTSDQTYLRVQTLLNNHTILTSSLKAQVPQDSDALTVRSIDSEIGVGSGLFRGISIVNISGLNSDVDFGSVPEDIWEGGGVYTGFPSSAETIEVFSGSANDSSAGTGARTALLLGLDTNYNEISETITFIRHYN